MRSAGRASPVGPRETWQILLAVVGLASCYALSAFLGLRYAIPPGNATAIWPPSGIALAGVLLLGPWAGAAIFLGATLANLTTTVSVSAAATIGLGNTLEALVGAWLLRRSGRATSAHFRNAVGVFGFASIAMLASAVGATVGVSVLGAGGRLHGSSLGLNWITWWMGDTAGLLIVTPFLIALRGPWSLPASRTRWIEAAFATLGLLLVSGMLFGGLLEGATARNLLYLPLFLLIWLALRFDLRGVTAATLVMTAAAVWGTSRGLGLYGGRALPESLLDQQLLMISYALAGLATVATVNRRRRAEAALVGSRHRLVRAVRERTAELEEAARALRRETAERIRLQEMERLCLATALDSAGEGIIITDADATITHVNPAFERMTGYSRDDVVGHSPHLLSSGEHDAAFYERLWETVSRGGIWRGSFVDRKKDSNRYEMDSTIAPIQESDGRLVGYVAVARDVTEQRGAERALRDSESRLRTIFASAADGILTVDDDGMIESANAAVEEMFGSRDGELIGHPVTALLPEFLDRAAAAPGPLLGVVRELTGRRRDGTSFRMDLTLNELRLEGRRLYAAFIRDVTERHARLDAERALLGTHEELRLAREIQQRFYPASAPVVPGFDIAGTSQPTEEAGGDYFDFLPMGPHVGLVIGDVSGHGFGAALLMSQARAYLRGLLLLTQDVGEMLARLNEFLVTDFGGVNFLTLFLARMDPAARRIVYASAGHQSHVLRADGRVEVLAATGIPLGILSRPIYDTAEVALDPGDLLLMMTDGIEETTSPEGRLLGTEKVLETVQANRRRPASEIVACLRTLAGEFAAGAKQHDDLTIVVARVLD